MVRKAVIPAAGMGTRFLPVTKSQPKEMLPIIDTPAIQYVVEEAVAAGIEDILIITGKGKRSIEDHFDRNYSLETRLAEKQCEDDLRSIRRLAEMADIHFIRQQELKGLGDAVRYARRHVGEEAFAVLLGDTVIQAETPAIADLVSAHERTGATVIGLEQVEENKVDRYGIAAGDRRKDGLITLTALIEKPDIGRSPSTLAIAGRYVLTPSIFPALEHTAAGKGGEIQLTDAIRLLLETESVYGCLLQGKRWDIGSKMDYLKTVVAFALSRKEFAGEFRQFLIRTLEEGSGSPD